MNKNTGYDSQNEKNKTLWDCITDFDTPHCHIGDMK